MSGLLHFKIAYLDVGRGWHRADRNMYNKTAREDVRTLDQLGSKRGERQGGSRQDIC